MIRDQHADFLGGHQRQRLGTRLGGDDAQLVIEQTPEHVQVRSIVVDVEDGGRHADASSLRQPLPSGRYFSRGSRVLFTTLSKPPASLPVSLMYSSRCFASSPSSFCACSRLRARWARPALRSS